MDWDLAITRNRDALLRIVAALYALAGLAQGAAFLVLPRHIQRAILRVLRPAESAVRRLVIIVAHGLVFNFGDSLFKSSRLPQDKLRLLKDFRKLPPKFARFALIDPLKRFAHERVAARSGIVPRVSVPGVFDPVFITPPVLSLDDLLPAVHISNRLAALQRALANLDAEAWRLARWRARRHMERRQTTQWKPGRLTPFRPVSPPGTRRRRVHEVDHVLRECHLLALDRLEDTS